MLFADIQSILYWWAFLLLIGVIFLPFASYFFSQFIDRGYIFGKTIGIIILSYAAFLFGTIHVLPFTRLSLFILLIFSTGILFLFFTQHFISALKKHWRIILFEEILFLGGICFWSYIRGFEPSIHGLEKFMDYGFINSILRSTYFPPRDMWLTPESINYYYFGHLVTAVLTKLSGIPSQITYNLMLATIFSLCVTSAFSIGSNLIGLLPRQIKHARVPAIIAGILTSLLVAFSGNLHILYTFFKPYENENPVPLWNLVFSPFSFPNSYWYPNATRFIYNTIHEFPMYSWVVADLHGHVLDIPFVLLTLAIVLSFCMRYLPEKATTQHSTRTQTFFKIKHILPMHLFSVLFLSFILSVMYMTNAWDGFIYLLLSLLLLFSIQWQRTTSLSSLASRLGIILSGLFVTVFILLLGFVIFSLPFSFSFNPSSIVSGIGILCMPQFLTDIGKFGPLLFEADHCQHSLWWQLLTLYGFFYFFVFSFFIFLRKVTKTYPSDMYVLLLIFLATMLILLPEFFYVKDIYPAHYRANTMFKLVFQSFIMLSLVSSYVLVRIVTSYRFRTLPHSLPSRLAFLTWIIISGVLVSLVMTYPFLATKSYYGDLKERKSLDGTLYLRDSYPSDYAAIQWINTSITGQPVILEAQGDSYTDYARVSSNTGLPTVLGWTVHEWLWRGSYDVPAPRIEEVKKLYESENIQETKDLIRKYKIELIFLGDLEREKYPALKEEKFSELGNIIFEKGETRIYKVSAALNHVNGQ